MTGKIRAMIDIGKQIEPIPCGEQQWQQDDSIAIIEIARREGTQVAVDE